MKHNITVQSLLKEKKNAFRSESSNRPTLAKMNAEIARLQKENAAANKRIEELTAKNLKLLNENNDLWDKVNNPKMKV